MRARARPRASIVIRGSVKLAVLPVPVWAIPRTSRPSRAGGIAPAWMGVGLSYPASTTALSTLGARFRSENFVMYVRMLRTISSPAAAIYVGPHGPRGDPIVATLGGAYQEAAFGSNAQVKSGKCRANFASKSRFISRSRLWPFKRSWSAGVSTATSS